MSGKIYTFVIVNDYSRFTWTLFLSHKDETYSSFVKFCKRVQNEKGYSINNIRSDRGRQFDNKDISTFHEENGFGQNFRHLEPHNKMV